MGTFFFYGTLCHAPLLEVVIGRKLQMEPAVLPGHTAFISRQASYPLIAPGGVAAPGMLARGLSDDETARLFFYENALTYGRYRVVPTAGGVHVEANVCVPTEDGWIATERWNQDLWEARWSDTVVAAARDYMAGYGRVSSHVLGARYPQMLIRAGARLRAETERPSALRRTAAAGDVVQTAMRQPYAKYFAVEEYDVQFRRFDGQMSEVLTRAVFISGDAAVVLPYDPVRDRVLVIEQWRAGPHARGAPNPWLIEAVAGRIDGGETPEQAARREAVEEAGISLKTLLPAASYYPSPAAKAEYLYTFVGIADLPDEAAGIGGLPGEGEDIRAHVIPFRQLIDLVDSGEADNAPLVLLALWLDRRRDALRRAAGV